MRDEFADRFREKFATLTKMLPSKHTSNSRCIIHAKVIYMCESRRISLEIFQSEASLEKSHTSVVREWPVGFRAFRSAIAAARLRGHRTEFADDASQSLRRARARGLANNSAPAVV